MVENFLDIQELNSGEICLRLEKAVPGNPEKGWVPAYHFSICDLLGNKMGTCDLRLGHNEQLYYGGNIGYRVEEPYRGHHYAAKACKLLFELAKMHEMGYVIISCNPENTASRKTCEYAGGTLLEIAELPEDNDMRQRGETQKCVFRFDLGATAEEQPLIRTDSIQTKQMLWEAHQTVMRQIHPGQTWIPAIAGVWGVAQCIYLGRYSGALLIFLVCLCVILNYRVFLVRKQCASFEEKLKDRGGIGRSEIWFYADKWVETDHSLNQKSVLEYSIITQVLESRHLLILCAANSFFIIDKVNLQPGEQKAILELIRKNHPGVKGKIYRKLHKM